MVPPQSPMSQTPKPSAGSELSTKELLAKKKESDNLKRAAELCAAIVDTPSNARVAQEKTRRQFQESDKAFAAPSTPPRAGAGFPGAPPTPKESFRKEELMSPSGLARPGPPSGPSRHASGSLGRDDRPITGYSAAQQRQSPLPSPETRVPSGQSPGPPSTPKVGSFLGAPCV